MDGVVVDLTDSDVEDPIVIAEDIGDNPVYDVGGIGEVETAKNMYALDDDLPPLPSFSAILSRASSSSTAACSSSSKEDVRMTLLNEEMNSRLGNEPVVKVGLIENALENKAENPLCLSQEIQVPNVTDSLESQKMLSDNQTETDPLSSESPSPEPEPLKKKKRVKKAPNPEILQKRAVKEHERQMKKLERDKIRSEKPSACLETMKIIIDENVPNPKSLDEMIRTELPQVEVHSGKLPFPGTILWTSTELQHDATDSRSIMTVNVNRTEPVVVAVVHLSEFLTLARRYDNGNSQQTEGETLVSFVDRFKRAFEEQFGKECVNAVRWTIFVEGVEKYFRHLQTIKNREFRTNVLSVSESQDSSQTASKSRKPTCPKELRGISTVISRHELMEAVMDLQFHHDVSVRYIEDTKQMARLLTVFTKSIAELPFKTKKAAARDFEVFLSNTGQKGFKFEPNGTGLTELFRAQLMQFQSVSADIADAIASRYSCAAALMRGYDSVVDKDGLLENVQVVRGSGVLETRRRIGRAMSKRIATVFNSVDGQESLT